MSVFMIWTYVVKSERQGEFMSLVQKLTEYAKENPKKFEEVKSCMHACKPVKII